MNELIELDRQVFLFFNSLHNPFWDQVMWIISGRFTWIPLYIAFIFSFFYKKDWRAGLITVAALVLLIVVADALARVPESQLLFDEAHTWPPPEVA